MSDETMAETTPTRQTDTKGSRHQWCRYSGPGRGDCEHSIGVPDELTDDNTDEYGIPDGWCDYCWLSRRLTQARAERDAWKRLADERDNALAIQGEHAIRLRAERDALAHVLKELVESDAYVTHGSPCLCYAHTVARKALASMETGHE